MVWDRAWRGPWVRGGLTRPHTDLPVVPGTRGGGGAGARGSGRGCGCSFRLEDSSFRRLGGVGCPAGSPQGGPGFAEVGALLSRRPAASGSSSACSGPARLRPCWGRGRGGPIGIWSKPWCTEKRVSLFFNYPT